MDEIDIERQLVELWKNRELYFSEGDEKNRVRQLCSDLQDYLHSGKIRDSKIFKTVRTHLDVFYQYIDFRHKKSSDEAAIKSIREAKPELSAFLDTV